MSGWIAVGWGTRRRNSVLESSWYTSLRTNWINWISPVTLQPHPDGSFRFSIDFYKLNTLTKTDSYSLKNCIGRAGSVKYISKVDLKQEFGQVNLMDRAKRVSLFVGDGQTYQCNVTPHGKKNSPVTCQRLINQVVDGLQNCVVYKDDVVVFTDT